MKAKIADVSIINLEQNINRMLGIVLLIFVLFFILSMLSYYPGDVIFASNRLEGYRNIFGYSGAHTAYFLMDVFGGAIYIYQILTFIIGLALLLGREIKYLIFRATLFLVFICLTCYLFSFLNAPVFWDFENFGGVIGSQLRKSFPLNGLIGMKLIPFILLDIYLALFIISISTKQLLRVIKGFSVIIFKVIGYFAGYIKKDINNLGIASLVRFNIWIKRLLNKFPAIRFAYKADKEKLSLFHQSFSSTDTAREPKRKKKLKIKEEQANNDADSEALQDDGHKIINNKDRATLNQRIIKGFELPDARYLLNKDTNKKVTLEINKEESARALMVILNDFGVIGKIIGVRVGPVVTLYEFEPAPGVKSSRIIGLADDIARSLGATSARIALVPGKNALGIELPNAKREVISFREIIESQEFTSKNNILPLALGRSIGGEVEVADLSKMPHLLIAGTTGSGKSVAINTMILSILFKFSPQQCKMMMIDPKMLELSIYDGIPHLIAPVVTNPKKAISALNWLVREMEERYKKMAKLNVRNIASYNQKVEALLAENGSDKPYTYRVQTGFDDETGRPIYENVELELKTIPHIVAVIDEMADLMIIAKKEVEPPIQRLAQMARASGIHLITATQRPSVDVITGVIKANFPTRISFQVTSKIDSRTIIGEQGAEQLLGMGDMLYMIGGSKIIRVHGAFVSDKEVEQVVNFLKSQASPEYIEDIENFEDENKGGRAATSSERKADENQSGNDEDLYLQAKEIVLSERKPSISYIQRRMKIGYNRAANLIERMEEEGIITTPRHNGKREIIE